MKNLLLKIAVLTAVSVVLLLLCGCGPSTPDECLRQGTLRIMEGRYKAARKLALKAEKLEPDSQRVLIFKAIASEKCGDYDMAVDSASRAVKVNSGSFIAQYTLGRLYAADPARSSEALRALMMALRLKPKDTSTIVLLCNLAVDNRAGYAINYLQMLNRDPEYAGSYAINNQCAVNYCQRRQYANARTNLLKAYERNGKKDPLLLLNLGRFFDCYVPNRKLAVAFYQEFLNVAGENERFARWTAETGERLNMLSGTGK